VDYTREAIIKRARYLAERLTRLADGLEQDPDYSFNTLGELQAMASNSTPGARSSASLARR
jgi:hypothetical protein